MIRFVLLLQLAAASYMGIYTGMEHKELKEAREMLRMSMKELGSFNIRG